MTLDARFLETDGEGLERLASVLQPSNQGRARAVVRGRRRVRSIDPWIISRHRRTDGPTGTEVTAGS